jgi:cytochrome b6-f complex iron-sulfur subunit
VARRDFLAGAGWGALLVAAGTAAAAVLRFLDPRVVTPATGPVEAGFPQEYPLGALTFVEPAKAYVGRDESGFYAIVAVCTHLGCTPRLEAGEFVCPCHGSRFTRAGDVLSGPAPRPLDRALVTRAANGRLVIDRGRPVGPAYRLLA